MQARGFGGRSRRRLLAATAVALLGSFIALLAPAAPAASASSAGAILAVGAVACTSASHPAVAAALARDIQAARRGRSSTVAVWVDDPGAGITCSLNGSAHFDSASIVKVTILGAVLRRALDQHRYLTASEVTLLRAMITKSDNNAAGQSRAVVPSALPRPRRDAADGARGRRLLGPDSGHRA
jgi:beta-lactamase class A